MKKSALIIGGGVSGLASARALARQGVSVTVVEAQNRLGGRIHTVFHNRVPIELGAEFVHGESKALLTTLEEAHLSTTPVNATNRLLNQGVFQDTDIWETAGKIFNRIRLQEPDVAFAEFLARQTDIETRDRNSVIHFVEGFNAAHANRISAHALFLAERASEQMNGSKQSRVTQGYSALIDFLAHEITKHDGVVLMNALCRQIAWKPGCVEVAVDSKGKTDIFSADVAIICLPVGILKSNQVQFSPALPEKLEAAHHLEFGNAVRLVFRFREPLGEDCGFVHLPDGPVPTWWNDPRGPLMVGWAGGPHAEALVKCPPSQLEDIGLQMLGQIFSAEKEKLRGKLAAMHYWNWAADPHIRGAYSYIPVNGVELPKTLAAPVAGTLFFAGEATVADAQQGTVFGALESGLRAAEEVLES